MKKMKEMKKVVLVLGQRRLWFRPLLPPTSREELSGGGGGGGVASGQEPASGVDSGSREDASGGSGAEEERRLRGVQIRSAEGRHAAVAQGRGLGEE